MSGMRSWISATSSSASVEREGEYPRGISKLISAPASATMHPQQAEMAAHRTTTIEIDHDVVVLLRTQAAAQRDTSVEHLIRDLLSVIASDGLTAAILDD